MLTSITLQNFKSFGEEQTVPLRPITAIVGPNNSGKSNLVSLARFVRNVVFDDVDAAVEMEGGPQLLLHRPAVHEGVARIAWTSTEGEYYTQFQDTPAGVLQGIERLQHRDHGDAWTDVEGVRKLSFYPRAGSVRQEAEEPGLTQGELMSGLAAIVDSKLQGAKDFRSIIEPLLFAGEIKLQHSALRRDAEVVPVPRLGSDGTGLASVLGLWRGSDPDRSEQLQEFIRRCLPEIRHVFVKPSPEPSFQRLWIQQTDGQQFDAEHVSDGVLFFIALAMHAVEAKPGSLLFVEEPEQCIHPRRVGMIMDLFRQVVAQRGCQVVVVTHSPVLLNELRDEPESIVLFRRGEQGTRVKQLTEMPSLIDALRDAEPGEMLANGFFDAPF